MLTPANLPGTYKLAWSKDPALKLPDDPEARVEALRIARQTGDWSPLIQPGQKPTWFICRWIPHLVYQRWWDLRGSGAIGAHEATATLLLLALVEVENFGEAKLELELSERFRTPMVAASFLDRLRAALRPLGHAADAIIVELAAAILDQEETTRPL